MTSLAVLALATLGVYEGTFLDGDAHRVGGTNFVSGGVKVVVETYERQSAPAYVVKTEAGDGIVDLGMLRRTGDPVRVDLKDGTIERLKDFRSVRIGSDPILIAENAQVPRRTDWRKMSPEEIVDAWYRPHQRSRVKADVSGQDWTRMKTEDFLPCIDKFGQFKYRDWPGKTHSEAELKASAAEEEKDLAAHPGPRGWNRFGGWVAGPRFAATGRFRTEKVNGRWWFVDPEGCLFWSFGPVRVTPSSALTPLNGNPRTPRCGAAMPDRDCLFEELPAKDSPFAQFYDTYDALLLPFYLKRDETRRYDHSAANLYRKYGADWFVKFSDSCHRRLRSWGANTIANSSDLRICLQDRTPYAERVECQSRPIEGSWGQWFKFRDPFDPSFTEGVRTALAEHGREAHDPWCIGFFIDNEIQWGARHEDLARWTLWSPDDQPAKVEFLRRLKAKGIAWTGDVDAVPAAELRAFTDVIVEEYFRRTRETVKAFDPGLLYLGCRFAGSARPWALRACARHCDVVSYNIYADEIGNWRLPERLDAPVVIGEFHFGAHDRGLFGCSLINKGSQEGRAAALRKYVASALRNPQIVGVHWHQFSDQSVTGRFDGEFFQVGWTDVCDRPYPETVAAVRTVGYPLYETRAGVGEAGGIKVDNLMPGGNIEFVRAEDETIVLRNEMRDTEGWWYWWAFRVRGAAGRRCVFRFEKNRGWDENVSNRGACVSLDGGCTWSYTEREPFSPQQFTYTFPKDANEVWFAMSVPYGLREWEAFVGRHRNEAALRLGTLCASRHGRAVPLARIGSVGARYRVFLSSRHHCAETSATFVLEGVLEGALAQDALGDWFRRNVEIVCVPMMDLDGVVEGDQGKHRAPHDYNRDYTEFIWPETRAVRDLLTDGRKVDAFIDFHCPHYNDPRIHLMMCRAGRTEANQDALAALVEKNAKGLVYRRKNNYPWGDTWNCDRLYATGVSSTIWATRLPGIRFSGCYEIPFSDTREDRTGPAGAPITPENCRAFGRSVAQSLREFLANESYGPVLPPPSAVGAVLFSQKEVPAEGGEWPVPDELARMENGFAVEFTMTAAEKPAPWTGVLQARFREKDQIRLPFSFGSDDRGRVYFRMDTHFSVNEQNVAVASPVFDGKPHRVRLTFEPSAACANDTRVVCQIDGVEAFRIDRRRGRVGFSSVFANTIAVGRARSPFRGRVGDIRITKIK